MAKEQMLLTQKYLQDVLSYDPDAGEFVWRATTRPGHAGKAAGCLRKTGYASINVGGRLYQAHRLVWLYIHGRWPENHIDHINGNKSDNRLVNLREASPSQNIANSRISMANKTGFKGVSFDKRKRMYRACLGKDGKQLFLGYYDAPQDAHAAYAKAAKESHGAFAKFA
jgi:hypothetical protein